MPEGADPIDWERHATHNKGCPHCGTGYPRPCGKCGGEVHREVMTLPGGGYIQLTQCDGCLMPDGR